jgi:hypothetical protein
MTNDKIVFRLLWILPSDKVTCQPPKPMLRDFQTWDEAVAFLRSLRNRFGEIICCLEARCTTPGHGGVMS